MMVGWQLVESPTDLVLEDPHCSGVGAVVLLATGWTVLTGGRGDEASEKNSDALSRSGLATP